MRVALVSPYSWTYPGGVTRHIEALAGELAAIGHEVRVFAPYDCDTRRTALLHRGARPQRRPLPDYLEPVGTTVGWPANGAISNLAITPSAVSRSRTALRAFAPDVVHVHEPVAPIVGWDVLTSVDAPLIGTFHAFSQSVPAHTLAVLLGARRKLNRLHVRIAVSEAAAWTARRFYGGRYRIVPNGVALPSGGVPAPRIRRPGDRLRIAFVGQAVERKGLPVLLRAFEALRRELPAELTVVGATAAEVAPLLVDGDGVRVLGRVADEERGRVLAEADVLAAPSLGGESFGMVLTEAFATGTPVVASDIAGYRAVVEHGENGLLVPRGDAAALGETLRELAIDPATAHRLGRGAARSAQRYAWPRVAAEVAGAYEDARCVPRPARALGRAAVRVGAVPADGLPRVPARRLPPMDPVPAAPRRLRAARRAAFVAAGSAAAAGAYLALDRIGVESVLSSLLASSPAWVLLATAAMCAAMILRAGAWLAILRAALPDGRPRFVDAFQGTTIGVLMSATLPARLGEPSRAFIVARRLGDARERLPVVLGTLVSQTLLNVLALLVLGTVMVTTVGLFQGGQRALIVYALAPLALAALVLLAPALLRRGVPSRSARVARWIAAGRAGSSRVRSGLRVFAHPRRGPQAVLLQLGAWALQWVACYLLLVALGLEEQAGIGAAAAVLFAVNVTAVLPLTPSNLGVFQAACIAVLAGGYGVSVADALTFGIVLQAVEIATAVVMGAPALVKEGLSWREVRLRALHGAPVSLAPRGSRAVEDLA